MAQFRLIHASDMHFAAQSGLINAYDTRGFWGLVGQAFSPNFKQTVVLSSFNPDTAAAFAHAVGTAANSIDAVILTGDIATTGRTEDLIAARAFLQGHADTFLPNRSAALVGPAHMPPVIIMPGNHDRYTRLPFFPESKEFEAVFGPHWDFQSQPVASWHATHRFVRTTVLQKHSSLLALCRVDFSLTEKNQSDPGPLDYMGQGRVRSKSAARGPLDALDELIAQTKAVQQLAADVQVIWCVHFPPGFPDIRPEMRLIDEDDLLSAAQTQDIKLVLSGHTHQYANYLINQGAARVICCGTTCGTAHNDQNVFLELLIDTADLLNPQVTQRRWNPSARSKSFE